MDEYIHHSLCSEIFQSKHYRKEALKELKKMGVDLPSDAKHDKICEALQKTVCRINDFDESCNDGEVSFTCGGKQYCMTPSALKKKMKDPKWNARFSRTQKRKLDRVTMRESSAQKQLPCHVLSGSESACLSNGACQYHKGQSLIGALFANGKKMRNAGECHMSPSHMRKIRKYAETKKNTGISREMLESAIMDLLFEQAEKSRAKYRFSSTIEMYQFYDGLARIDNERAYHMYNMNTDELLEAVIELSDPVEPRGIDVAKSIVSLTKVLGVNGRYFDEDNQFARHVGKAMGFKISRETSVIITACLSIVLFAVENGFVSWGLWLLLYPNGRASIKRFLKDPSNAAFFMLALSLTGIKGDTFLPNIAQLGGTLTKGLPYGAIMNQLEGVLRTVVAGQVVWGEATKDDLKRAHLGSDVKKRNAKLTGTIKSIMRKIRENERESEKK